MTLKHKERETVTDLLEGALQTTSIYEMKQVISHVLSILDNSLLKNEDTQKIRSMGFKPNYGRSNPMSETSRCLNALCNTIALYGFAEEDVKLANKQQEDILHAIELLDEDDIDMQEMLEDLKVIRKQRRNAKDYLELAKPLHRVAIQYEVIRKDLSKALKEIQKIQLLHVNRTYTPRAINSLEVVFDKAKQRELAM